jgi:phospholipid transport system substrate-binding protein
VGTVLALTSIGGSMMQREIRAWLRRAVVVTAALLASGVATAVAGEPTNELRQHVDQALRVLADPALNDKPDERRAAVFKIAEDVVDFGEIARLSLGRHWQRLSAAEHTEFTHLLATVIERSYMTYVESYDGEKVTYTGETIDGDRAVVRSKIVTKQGEQTRVDYRMVRAPGGTWRIYDIVMEGVSLVSSYRAQFNQVMRTGSYQDLVHRLKAKQTAPPPAASPTTN